MAHKRRLTVHTHSPPTHTVLHRNCQFDPPRGFTHGKKTNFRIQQRNTQARLRGPKGVDLAALGGEERRKRWKGGEEMNDCASEPVGVIRTEEGRVKIRFYNDSRATDRSVQQMRETERGGSRVRRRSVHRR